MDLKKQRTIHIGEYFGSSKPTVIKTLLGSCVAVCLFDPVSRIGGMNHIFLPGRADTKHFDAQARFGINAMELLINKLMTLGADRSRFQAKAFGGARVLPSIRAENSTGPKISDFVTNFLKTEAIELVASDLGGIQGRVVRFETFTGDAYVKKIHSPYLDCILKQEKDGLVQIRREIDKPGAVTLFKNS